MHKRLPLVIILGATGSGKTKLSLEIAQQFGGEIIGADSMQIYKGLDVITAKATKQEQAAAVHHCIDILNPQEIYTVVDYRNKALKIINDLFTKSKLPIVVGGTNYYIESLLWKILVANPDEKVKITPGWLPNNEHELPSEQLYKKLQLLDPAMAKRLHPNNKRKILRSLEVLHLKGKKHSEILDEQQNSKGGSKSGGGLRFPNAIVFWLQCDQRVLDNRLNSRVDSMLDEGLLDELTNFHLNYNENRLNPTDAPDYTRGIFQSIGLKEFHSYLMLDEETKCGTEGNKKLLEGIEQLKMITRRYARKQNRWIVNRFLGRTDRQVPPVYGLDTTNVEEWQKNVTAPAIEIVESYINETNCKYERLPFQDGKSAPNALDDTHRCDVCERIFVGTFQWELHRKSNNHKRRAASLQKQKQKESELDEVKK